MNKTKLIWGIVIGVFSIIALFCLSVCVSCSITGMTFGEQVINWFTGSKPAVEQIENVIKNIKG